MEHLGAAGLARGWAGAGEACEDSEGECDYYGALVSVANETMMTERDFST